MHNHKQSKCVFRPRSSTLARFGAHKRLAVAPEFCTQCALNAFTATNSKFPVDKNSFVCKAYLLRARHAVSTDARRERTKTGKARRDKRLRRK
jgi:hypothetical protein